MKLMGTPRKGDPNKIRFRFGLITPGEHKDYMGVDRMRLVRALIDFKQYWKLQHKFQTKKIEGGVRVTRLNA